MRKKLEGVRVSALNNLAACSLKEGRYEDTVGFCEDVLRANSRDVKAMYRLGQVRTRQTHSLARARLKADHAERKSRSLETAVSKTDLADSSASSAP